MRIIKFIFKIIIKIIKVALFLPMILMQPKYKYNIDETQKEIDELIK